MTIDSLTAVTPMMAQYLETKSQHQDCLLFYRMGDFYELFFEDAITAADVLDITLSKRGKHQGEDIPMCGVPFHSADPYLQKLIQKGFKVAICEQIETPEEAKKRGYKAVVRRDVVRILTPGTLTEESMLDASESNYLLAISQEEERIGIAFVDISTGELSCMSVGANDMMQALATIEPKEVLLPYELRHIKHELFQGRAKPPCVTPMERIQYTAKRGQEQLRTTLAVASLEAFGQFSDEEYTAFSMLLDYLQLTQKQGNLDLRPPKQQAMHSMMRIDPATRRSLELSQCLNGEKKGSLLDVMDQCRTSAGSRLLAHYILKPSLVISEIEARLDRIESFVTNDGLRDAIRGRLHHLPDSERAVSRLCMGRGSPRDLGSLRKALLIIEEIKSVVASTPLVSPLIQEIAKSLSGCPVLATILGNALEDELPFLARDGRIIKEGYHEELDRLRHLGRDAREALASLQETYRGHTGITTLKITHNHMLGYFIEIASQHSSKMDPAYFNHRQTMAGAMRYTSNELKRLESDILGAKDKMVALEVALFHELVAEVANHATPLRRSAQLLAELDVASSLAETARKYHYVRPCIDPSLAFTIEGGRHPVVEHMLAKASKKQPFIPNHCQLEDQTRLSLLTGPNMAGKSTFLRQNATIAILAQAGCFVPATRAHIGLIDQCFSRVGAADDLSRGQSTFMVEMIETAAILHHATNRSFIILDEIGRGTATYDGVSLAWAVVEYIHDVTKARTIFATHYHELTQLSNSLSNLSCLTMAVKETGDNITFLHEVRPGSADRSYGIHVAKLAGLPASVLKRAASILSTLESSSKPTHDLPLFSYAAKVEQPPVAPHPLEMEIKELDIDELSPRDAHNLLYMWRKRFLAS